ncbi:MAG: Na+/H+ antiporter NhaC family protein, partial [Gammaproteobacteria bacterium]
MSDSAKPEKNLPSLTHAIVCLLGLFSWIAFGLFILEAALHGVLMLGLVWVAANALILAPNYSQIREAMLSGASRAMPAMFIFLLIGIVIVTFIQAGTIGTLIYYGLEFMHPGIVLPAGLILCSLMSLAVGTSWGTVATGGIVLMGVGGAMGIPLPIIAGMVISGASFGDKMSPVSDTTNLSALSAETGLYQHIRSMAYTTGPTYLIVLLIFSWIGWGYADQALPQARLDMLLDGLEQAFKINIIMLLPLVVLFALAMKRVPAEAAMMISSLTAGLMAIA